MDEGGNILWTNTFGESFLPGNCIVSQLDATTLVTKWYAKRNTPNFDQNPPALYFMGLDGQVQDTFVFENQTLSDIDDIAATPEGGVVGCGDRQETIETYPRIPWLFRMGSDRAIEWEREYKDTTFEGQSLSLLSVAPTRDGGYILAGTVSNAMTGVRETHNWVLKLDAEGCLKPGCGVRNILTGGEEPVFMEGLGIQVSPNPADAWLRVDFPAAFDWSKGRVEVSLLSATGRLVQSVRAAGSAVSLALSEVPAGTYFVVLRRGERVVCSKRVVVGH